jgi:cytochrome c-type biogenesis protein CcmH
MRNRWIQAGLVGVMIAAISVVLVGLASGDGEPRNRAYALQQQLRCPVCQSVSIAESMSETAEAMREKVDQLIKAGKTDQQILGYFRARYGEWVITDPPASGNTLLVWLLPVLAGAAGTAVVLLRTRRRRSGADELTPEMRDRVAAEVARTSTSAAREDSL